VPIPRGHLQQLEAQINYLQQLVGDLQVQVKELGGEPRVHPAPFNGASPSSWNATNTEGDMHGWGAETDRTSASPSPGYATTAAVGTGAEGAHLPEFKRGSIGDNYVGVSSADSLVSHIKGTSLSVFGTEIDITDFVEGAGEEDYEQSPMSYQNYLKVAFNIDQTVEEIPFPDHDQLRTYTFWYLRGLNPYTMLLDKRSFMSLVDRIGTDPNFKPSVAETVQVHMMLAMIKYQLSLRNQDPAMMEGSHKHYRYGASMFSRLYIGHELEDLQAMTMICVHLRNFAKPGAAWIMCSTTFQLAVEFGLHRSHSAWADTGSGKSATEVEMRKRIFWTLHALAVSLSGKLGRPMPIAWADMDVEFPEPIVDSLPEDAGPARCSFRVGIETVKFSVISSKLYRTIYAVRQSTHHYERTVRQLEKEAQEWKDHLPYDLAEGGRASEESHIHALYLEFWNQQFQLLLHHPAVCRSTDPNFISSNLDKCLAASSRILRNCTELRKHNSLDTPWINSVVYIAAIFTTLFIYYQRRDRLSSDDLTNLTSEMSLWLEVMEGCGVLIGTGDKLKTALHRIIVPSLNSISEHVHKKTTEAVARAALQAPQDTSQATTTYGNGNTLHEPYPNAVAGQTVATGRAPYVASDGNTVNAPSNIYSTVQTTPSFGYNSGGSAPMTVYPPTSAPYEQSSFHVADDASLSAAHANVLASAASGGPSQRTQPFIYGDASGSNNGHSAQYPVDVAGPTGWMSWTKAIMPSARLTGDYGPPPEFLNTANTLMSLGGREATAQDQGVVPHGHNNVDGPNIQAPGLQRVQWPENLFNISPNGHAS
jgi:hypothetical protein